MIRLLLATGGMSVAVLLLVPDNTLWLEWAWQRRALEMGLVCGAGGAVYLLSHLLLGTRVRHLRPPAAL